MTHTAFADQVTANAPARAARAGASLQHHQTITAVSIRSRVATLDSRLRIRSAGKLGADA